MRAAPLAAAVALVLLALAIAGQGMSGHMAAHMIAVAVAAPLVALGLPHRRRAASPLAMSVVELAVVWLWHVPAVRTAAGHGAVARAGELACFLLAGVLLWSAVLAQRAPARAEGVGALLLTSMHMTLLGALVALAPRPLYPDLMHPGPFGLSPMEDQQLGGTIMLAIGGAAYLVGGLAMLATLLRGEAKAA